MSGSQTPPRPIDTHGESDAHRTHPNQPAHVPPLQEAPLRVHHLARKLGGEPRPRRLRAVLGAASRRGEVADRPLTMETEAGVASLTGRSHRATGRPNEDRTRQLDGRVRIAAEAGRGFVYCVADGVGGAPLGMRAAQHLVSDLSRFYQTPLPELEIGALQAIIEAASRTVHGWGQVEVEDAQGVWIPTDRPLGAAAATVAWFAPGGPLHILQVGDTAAFVIRRGVAERVTALHGAGRALVRFIGQADVVVEVTQPSFDDGDFLVLVSDGVWGAKGADVIARVVGAARDPQGAADRLVALAVERGSQDDVTAVVVELLEW